MPKEKWEMYKLIHLAGCLSALICSSNVSAFECRRQESSVAASANQEIRKIILKTCFTSASSGYVQVLIRYKRHDKNQVLNVAFEGESFVPSIDETIDFNGDRFGDLGIANGKGRGADGYDYWLFDPKKLRYSRIGDYPQLMADKSNPSEFFYLVSTNDDFFARRYNLILGPQGLRLKSVYGFSACPSQESCTEVILLEPRKTMPTRRRLSELETLQCMDGTASCL